jgi:DNA-binding LacI/PurR family transcriptional regulator
VLIPDEKIADLVNLLGSLGHKALLFAFSDRFARSSVLDDRYQTARRAWESRGMDPDTLRMFVYTEGSGEHARLLREAASSGFTAAVSYNDVSALGLYGLAASAGLRLPEDFSVVGFDDIAMAQLSSPSLTTIHVDRKGLVSRCFDLLGALEAGGAPLRLQDSVRTDLVIRRSAFRAP